MVDPWDEIERLWNQTFDHRQREFDNNHWSIVEYIDKYNCLKEPMGLNLVIFLFHYYHIFE